MHFEVSCAYFHCLINFLVCGAKINFLQCYFHSKNFSWFSWFYFFYGILLIWCLYAQFLLKSNYLKKMYPWMMPFSSGSLLPFFNLVYSRELCTMLEFIQSYYACHCMWNSYMHWIISSNIFCGVLAVFSVVVVSLTSRHLEMRFAKCLYG